ncbi:hypothetical protein EYF80_009843 [Liparis tanakae]|uniref:Uncharacterized protein n=1 Tax=Liparis tanakae TaxID=230148 RepID=A0A4Z2IPL2_9TELE|nr:hypothetical protein EYF80_009843 [Liparis tanakae]
MRRMMNRFINCQTELSGGIIMIHFPLTVTPPPPPTPYPTTGSLPDVTKETDRDYIYGSRTNGGENQPPGWKSLPNRRGPTVRAAGAPRSPSGVAGPQTKRIQPTVGLRYSEITSSALHISFGDVVACRQQLGVGGVKNDTGLLLNTDTSPPLSVSFEKAIARIPSYLWIVSVHLEVLLHSHDCIQQISSLAMPGGDLVTLDPTSHKEAIPS